MFPNVGFIICRSSSIIFFFFERTATNIYIIVTRHCFLLHNSYYNTPFLPL
ncbi:hypothetical protein Lalb_Chr19g0140191 [Lupinus albus]|uniref:Uncharacterized protein n=1 Tax=Lupinus albus TaxID=3870 RepID=A0A6A4NMX6_LUPAL|nr:hypothetical protein Lalb_Chr19g0140191 [Lupinus albus]